MAQTILLPHQSPSPAIEKPSPGFTPQALTQIQASTGFRLYSPDQIDRLDSDRLPQREQRQLRATMRWIENFIMQPHRGLGRPGVVCPYVKFSLDASIFYLSVANQKNPYRFDEIFEIMHTHADIFSRMEPQSGPLENLRVLMVLVPNGKEHVLSHPDLSKRLKTEMMQQNVTIGQFFPTLHPVKFAKAKFFPNQPPFCMYTMRTFIRSDWMFIHGEPEWRDVYHEKFGAPPDLRQGFTL
jgi:hypothetical protein